MTDRTWPTLDDDRYLVCPECWGFVNEVNPATVDPVTGHDVDCWVGHLTTELARLQAKLAQVDYWLSRLDLTPLDEARNTITETPPECEECSTRARIRIDYPGGLVWFCLECGNQWPAEGI